MTDKEKINLLLVTLLRVECLLEDTDALKLWWKDALLVIEKVLHP